MFKVHYSEEEPWMQLTSKFILPQPLLLCKLQKYDAYKNVSPEGEKIKEYGKGK